MHAFLLSLTNVPAGPIIVCKEAKLPLIRFSVRAIELMLNSILNRIKLSYASLLHHTAVGLSHVVVFFCNEVSDSHVIKSFPHSHISFFGLALWKKRINSSFICGYSIIVVGGSRYLNQSIS
jgi:hypothetical protein